LMIGGESIGEIGDLGFGILMSLLKSLPESLVSRLRLKLPKAYSRTPPSGVDPRSSPLNPQSLAKLLKLKFPEAYSLCCS